MRDILNPDGSLHGFDFTDDVPETEKAIMQDWLVKNALPDPVVKGWQVNVRDLPGGLSTSYRLNTPGVDRMLMREKVLYYTGHDTYRAVGGDCNVDPKGFAQLMQISSQGNSYGWNPYPNRGLYAPLSPLRQAIHTAATGGHPKDAY